MLVVMLFIFGPLLTLLVFSVVILYYGYYIEWAKIYCFDTSYLLLLLMFDTVFWMWLLI